jgi:hypothetical protein
MFQPVCETFAPDRPSSVDQVVDLLYQDLSLRDRVVMAQLSEDQLNCSVYLAIAKIIRKEFGLYSGNTELRESCSSYLGREYDRYEDHAMVIVKELWKKIKRTHSLHLVQ